MVGFTHTMKNDLCINCGKVGILWVKKLIKNKEWEAEAHYNSSYSFLEKTKEGVWAGFEIPYFGSLPPGCFKLSDEELRLVDIDRRATRTYPLPLTQIENV